MSLGTARRKALRLPARHTAVAAGVSAVLLASSGSAYACTTNASADEGRSLVGSRFVTQDELAAFKAQLAADAAAIRAAKAAELAAIQAHNKAALIAAAKAKAAAAAKLRADVEAAMAKARAAAKARAEARAAAAAKTGDDRFGDPRHHCDGHWGDNDSRHDGWSEAGWDSWHR